MPSAVLMLPLLLAAGTDVTCESVAQCNERGTAAYKAGRLDEAMRLFDRQIDYADTALGEAETETPALRRAQDVAINNAVLAHLRAGLCLKARAYLDLADAAAPATQTNRKQFDARCADALQDDAHTGTFWQYAGHGAWNEATLRPAADGKLRFDGNWMRIGRGPIDEYGPAAFGAMEDVELERDGDAWTGRFEGNDGEWGCELRMTPQRHAIEIEVTDDANCHTGGMGAYLGGRYVRVEDR